MKHLTQKQRYEISAYLKAGRTNKEIAELIGVSPSTIGRELRRNCCFPSAYYDPEEAQQKARHRLANKRKKERLTLEMKVLI